MLTTLRLLAPPWLYRWVLERIGIRIEDLHEWAESLCMCEVFNCFDDDEEDTTNDHLHVL